MEANNWFSKGERILYSAEDCFFWTLALVFIAKKKKNQENSEFFLFFFTSHFCYSPLKSYLEVTCHVLNCSFIQQYPKQKDKYLNLWHRINHGTSRYNFMVFVQFQSADGFF